MNIKEFIKEFAEDFGFENKNITVIIGDDDGIDVESAEKEFCCNATPQEECNCECQKEGKCEHEGCEPKPEKITITEAAISASNLLQYFNDKSSAAVSMYNKGTATVAKEKGYKYTVEIKKL